MSLSYNKEIINKVQTHIKEYFDSDVDFVEEVTRWNNSFRRGTYQSLHQMATEGNFLCYTDEQRKFLQQLFNQSDSEASKFSNDKVMETYYHLIARDGSKLFKKLIK